MVQFLRHGGGEMRFIALGNWLFHTRNLIFPLAVPLALFPNPVIVDNSLWAVAVGTGVALLGQALRVLTVGLKYIIRGGRNGRIYAADLVTDGVYDHMRNPMYVGNLLIVAGISIASTCWVSVVLLVTMFGAAYAAIVAAEEDYLRDKFGPAYEAYCHDVPRWLPRLQGLGETLRGTEFHWSRVLVKEYGTPLVWISATVIVGLEDLWPSGDDSLRRSATLVMFVLVGVTALFSLVGWTLKKTRIVVG
jgi:protein-S-isoprenylcysteine O-methyltransferase Ste14